MVPQKHINIMGFLGSLMTFFSINDGNEFLTSFENISPKEL